MQAKILIVEDNPDNMALLEELLSGYELLKADSGAEALRLAAEERVALVLMDISLPEMDGTETMHRLRAMNGYADLRVVALTAHAMAGDRERYLERGFDSYLSKPIDFDALYQTVEQHLREWSG